MRLSKRQLKRIIREEYSRLKRRGLIKEANRNFDPDPFSNATWCVWETCEMEEGSTQITHDMHYIAEQFDLDQLLSQYIKAGEPCTYDEMTDPTKGEGDQTASRWNKFLKAAGPEGSACADAFSDFWEQEYMG